MSTHDAWQFTDEEGNLYNFFDKQAREIAQGATEAAEQAGKTADSGLMIATRAHDTSNGLGRARKDYVKLGRCIEDTFASEVSFTSVPTWLAQRIAAADEGGYDDLDVGDYTKIQLLNPAGSEMIYQLGGFDHYTGVGDGDKINPHMLTMVPAVVYPDTVQFNPTNNNNGTATEKIPWRASALFAWCNGTFKGYLPQEWREKLLNVRLYMHIRQSGSGGLTADNGGEWNYLGEIWVPDEIEVWGSVRLGSPQNGATLIADTSRQLPIFENGRTVIRCHNGIRSNWWDRTASAGHATSACLVSIDGDASYTYASNTTLRVLPCFHMGA
ncbi:MAG: DUF6273 domain-containing protein [Eggerthellaceae bacterium]|nr:DUF6273 domain-containing protein [Eggerthellaceae bacterium]